MKAVVMPAPGRLEVEEVTTPQPERGGVVVKVESCSICGTDLKLLRYGHRAITYPHVLGHEIAGTIAALGSEVEGFSVGERVALGMQMPCNFCEECRRGRGNLCQNCRRFGYEYWGGFAQYVAVPRFGVERSIVKRLPENLSFDEAALAEPLACVMNGQNLVGVNLGETVVILGLGPIGYLHALTAKARGAGKVIGTDVSDQRLEQASHFGVDVAVNSAQEDLREVVNRETEGRGAEVVIVAAPVKEAVSSSVHLAAFQGRVSFFAGLPKDDPVVTLDANVVHYRELQVFGASNETPELFQEALDLVARGQVDVKGLITHRVSLEKVAEGMKMMARGESLKVVVKPQR